MTDADDEAGWDCESEGSAPGMAMGGGDEPDERREEGDRRDDSTELRRPRDACDCGFAFGS